MGRYDSLAAGWFRRCGVSGLKLPAISLGCWHNFGGAGTGSRGITDEAAFHENCRKMLFAAFDLLWFHGLPSTSPLQVGRPRQTGSQAQDFEARQVREPRSPILASA